jgi:hypothetical protein
MSQSEGILALPWNEAKGESSMKRFVMGLVAATLAIGLLAGPVLAVATAIYSLTFTAEETLGNEWTTTPMLVGIDNQWYADHGYISWSATETRVKQGDTELPHLVAYDKIAFVPPLISPDSVSEFTYTTGNEPVPMKIVVGTGGYVTTPDNRALDLTVPWSITVNGYLDVDSGGILAEKVDSFSLDNSNYEEVTFNSGGAGAEWWEGQSPYTGQTVESLVTDGTWLYAGVRNEYPDYCWIIKIDPVTMTQVSSWHEDTMNTNISLAYSATTGFLYAAGYDSAHLDGQPIYKIDTAEMTTNNVRYVTEAPEAGYFSALTEAIRLSH